MLFLLISVYAEKFSEDLLLVIHLDLRNETQQILCLFHTLYVADAKVALVVLFLQGTILDMGSGISEYTGEHLAAIERTIHIAHKLQLHGTLLEHDFLTTQRLAQSAQTYHTHQLIRLPRNRTETVDHSLTEFSHLLFTLQMVEFAVEQHSLRTTRHVGIRKIGLQITLHGTVIHEIIAREQFSFIHLLLIQVVELLVLH